MHGYSLTFIIGIFLLLTNQLVGWGGLLMCAYLSRKMRKKRYYALGTVVYAVSWGMLVTGIVLAGPEGIKMIKRMVKPLHWETMVGTSAVILGIVWYVWEKNRNKTMPEAADNRPQ